jgi:hypothetical protein
MGWVFLRMGDPRPVKGGMSEPTKNDDCDRNNNRAELTGQRNNSGWPK